MDTIQINDFSFNFICVITPKKNSHDVPQNKFNNNESLALHQYGQGPFCSFTISKKSMKEGVYLLKINDDITYLGECENLSKRFNSGYGNISPRNCFIGGQSTNCRINNKIYEVANENVKVYFYETNNRFEVERELIMKLNPIWNISRGKSKLPHTNRNTNSNNFTTTIPKKSLTCRDEILSAVRHIMHEKGSNEFKVREVIDTMRQKKSTYSESTIQTHIVSKCCTNAPRHHAVVYNDFERIGRGLYKLLGGSN